MAQMQDPITKTMFDLFSVMADRKQAELDLERAQTKENLTGRTAIPGVMAELAKRREQEAKRQEKIRAASQQPQTPAAALTPPTVDVSGEAQARQSASSEKNAQFLADLAGKFAGGGGPQPATGSPGLSPGINPSGRMPGQPGPIAAGATGTAQTGAPGQQPTAPTPQPQAPGTTGTPNPLLAAQPIPQTRDLGIGEQILNIAAGLAFRNAQLFHSGVMGEEVLGYTTLDAQADDLAPGLAIIHGRRRDADPDVRAEAEKQWAIRMDELRKINPQLAIEAERRAEDLYLIADEQRRTGLDPLGDAKAEKFRREWAIEEKVIEGKPLTPGEQQWWDRRSTRGQTNVTVNLPSEAKNKIIGTLESGRMSIQKMDSVVSAMKDMEWAFTKEGKLEMFRLQELKEGSPLVFGQLSETERKRVETFSRLQTAIKNFSAPAIHELIGATMTKAELEFVTDLFPSLDKGFETNKANLAELREAYALSLFRNETVLARQSALGIDDMHPDDAKYAMSLGATKQAAINAVVERQLTLEDQGFTPADAQRRVVDEFRWRYGLDVYHLMGTQ